MGDSSILAGNPAGNTDMSIISNKKAFHDYFVEEQFEAGIVLEGWEIKAIRAGRANIKESYVIIRDGEVFIFGMHITPLAQASTHVKPDPVRTRKLKRSSQRIWLLGLRRADGAVWLAPRPTPGVWAGLQCFPLFDDEASLLAALPSPLGTAVEMLPVFTHVLTHKDLFMHPARIDIAQAAIDLGAGSWFLPAQWAAAGLPAPVRKLLEN